MKKEEYSISKNEGPDFIGIGVMKAATTWIFFCLAEHPEICVYPKKEIYFFSNYYNYKKGIKYYKSFFNHCPKKKIKGEYTPNYISFPQSASFIHNHFPNVKIIVCLRDPAERAFSLYRYHIEFKGRLRIYKTFFEALKKDKAFVERGFYFKQLKRYFDLFPKENILVLFYKDIKKSPIKFISEIFEFLDLEDKNFVPTSLNKKDNITKGNRVMVNKNPVLEFIIQLYEKIIWRYMEQSWLKKKIDKSRFKEYIIQNIEKNRKVIRKRNIEVISISPLDDKTRKNLNQTIFKKDILKLEKLLNKDLSCWM